MKKKVALSVKYFFDFFVALFILPLVLPIFAVCSLLILIFDGRPIFFVQERPGLNEKIFKILKFRTMRPSVSHEDISDTQRTTKIGNFLRLTSLDELPQLFNVLKGELSLVGPRPLLVEYLNLYSNEQKKRHLVKPGITGWAQINGRNAITWEEKFEYDIWYVNNWSLWLDFKILFLTFFKVFKRSDVNASQHTTMEKFRGNRNETL